MFSAGHANTALSLALVLQALGHEVIFLHKQEGQDWWDDGKELASAAPKRQLLDTFVQAGQPLDLVIESSFFLSPLQRPKVAKRCIWYNRKPGLFTDIESTVYGCRPDGRNLEGLSAVLVADVFTSHEDIIYFQTLYPRIPIYTVPWVWTPEIIESHRKTTQSPVWQQVFKAVNSDVNWSFHIAETNMSSTSSCTLPLVIMRSLSVNSKRKVPISRITVHNTELLRDNKFFKENILSHCSLTDISYNLFGRQRIIDWVHDPKSIIVSHNRFVSLKMANIEAVWVGIPIVHNSEVLKSFGSGLEKLYYEGNSVTGACAAIHTAVFNTSDLPYLDTLDGLTEVRKQILARFYPAVKADGWDKVFKIIFDAPVLEPLAAPVVPMGPVAAPVVPMGPVAVPIANPVAAPVTEFSVLFCDMWDQFNETHNMFILSLEAALSNIKINGFSKETLDDKKPDLVIFGPFGEAWRTLPSSWPKVHFSGENSPPVNDPSVKLNIGYRLPDISDNTYLRMPLWQLEIDWFGADPEKIRNPIPLPIDSCTKPQITERTKFCAFVVTNPMNPVRNQAFQTLNNYKPVDSAGRLYNNIGDKIFAGLGGGGGELKKHEFLKSYRFCVAYENSSSPGYTTEKLLHAKAAGCVPIYWGDSKVNRDFSEKGFINANNCKTAEDLIALVDEVERDPVKWNSIASVPALNSYNRDLVRRNFAEFVRRCIKISGRAELLKDLPNFIGAKTSEEAAAMRAKRSGKTLFVTGVTKKFWYFLSSWLNSVTDKSDTVRVYVGSDVPVSDIEIMKSNYKSVEFVQFPTTCPEGFSDFWDPKHYAWKLFIFHHIINDAKVKGNLVFYMDVASVLVKMPEEWMALTRETGVSFLDDCRQKNRSWCHEEFCRVLDVTQMEKDSQQIAACLIMFVASHPAAVRLFNDAYSYGCMRNVIVGEKWAGMGPDGQPFGHRHDQSILSILSDRQGIKRWPIDLIYGDKSLRNTIAAGQAVYVHRGNFQNHKAILPGIDDAHVINLDRRGDRLKSFSEAHPSLAGLVKRHAAHDGRSLKLTKGLAELFKPNDFFWKKAVMGCALSHLDLWSALSNESIDINSYLILEDDARLDPSWKDAWNKAYPSLPADWDGVYLGGILPPNRSTFTQTLERIAPGLARVAPNQIFGQPMKTRYFHFCAYAYVLSKRGANKILNTIKERGGYWTSADHMVCNRVDSMNLYVLDPLVAGASQDNDPAYQTAQFNNFSRIDNFDSDLWNNDERFTVDEIKAFLEPAVPMKSAGPRFICLNTSMENGSKLYEANWLQDIFQFKNFNIESVSATETLAITDDLIVVLIKPQWAEQLAWLEALRGSGRTFKILHLSDEFGSDPIHMYSWPEVKGVMRFYQRADLPADPKIMVIPLGYHWQFRGNRDAPHLSTPNLPFRDNMWSFAGTDWKGRSRDMAILQAIQPHYLKWFAEWRDPAQLKDEEYISLMLNTKFVPCPRGQNVETYRFYEALECGCVPLFVDIPENEAWLKTFNNEIPFLKLQGWEHAAGIMDYFSKNVEQMEQYRMAILISWAKYKAGLKERVRVWLGK
jgi:GR25 family glycosyltransferase involved in LPS biosynthesis